MSAPDPLLRSTLAPSPRTLVDVFRETVRQHPDEPAISAGAAVLTYAEAEEAAEEVAAELAAGGVGPGDTVGVRVTSGTTDIHVAVLGVLLAGAAYVPVDADDPEERARLVFGEADVVAVVGDDLELAWHRERESVEAADPGPDDDAWVIFTSGSTGTPKGVAVSHRSAAAFVDAEARWFLTAGGDQAPLGPGDRVMAGLSVAFDASCEEMWLAWRHGACLVPAPRALVRSGVDVGPWLVANDITAVSTVPTLVALWPAEALAKVRLLIFGGEALPPEVVARVVAPGREVWNTYGPTEATVVACGAQVTTDGPVRIGLPLDGWDLEVVDGDGQPVADGGTGELIIGGVGLARYLDPAKDAEKYAAMPTLGWDRAYRSGDLVVRDPAGLLFRGRADDQVKLGGRRIELGEIDSALLALPGVQGAAAAVRRTAAGNQLLVGYLQVDDSYDAASAGKALRASVPAALVPRLAVVRTLPTRTSGKVDRDALPWPLPATTESAEGAAGRLDPTQAWLGELLDEILGARVTSPEADFFDLGGGSLTAAQLVSRLRQRHPEVAVADVYEHPTVRDLARHLDALAAAAGDGALPADRRAVRPIRTKTQVGQVLGSVALRWLSAPRWLAWVALAAQLLAAAGATWLPTLGWPAVAGLGLVFLSPPGRLLLAALVVRLLLAPVTAGEHPRGGKVHLRLWVATRAADEIGATSLSSAPWLTWYARLLGARVGRDVDLHALPPVTGMLRLGRGCSVEPEVDLTGYWVDGDVVHVGEVRVGARARVGARSMLCPGADVGKGAEVAPGSAVFGVVPDGEYWSGSPAERARGSARGPWEERPSASRLWTLAYGAGAVLLAGLPVLAVLAGAATVLGIGGVPDDLGALAGLLWWLPVGVVVGLVVLAGLVLAVVRVAGRVLTPGYHPVRSAPGLAVWATVRVLDEARTWLFALYSSLLTPAWLRLLGARIGKDVEASTVLMLPSLTQVGAEAFLADDTLIGGYELGAGWVRVERVKIGKRAFVGNSGMAAPGRKVPKASLVAVLSAAPRRKQAKSGESWLGSPPVSLRRVAETDAGGRTFAPPRRLRVARSLVEACRLVPVVLTVLLAGLVALATTYLLEAGVGWALLGLGPVLVVAGLVAAATTVAAKWLLVGRLRPGTHPLWSSFIWRNELSDTFVETLAAPWFARVVTGTPVLNAWLRALGARVGRGVWCESYWLPEADLVELGDGATVNAGTVVQTHLFHDRVFGKDRVRLEAGATLGPNCVVLPAASIGRHATVGPASLVMRGESVPEKTTWIGNPIGPWDVR